MPKPEHNISFHEIIFTLLGERGINTIKGLPPKNVSLIPGGIGWFNDPTHPSRRKIPYDDLEDDENRRETQLKITDEIENAIRTGEISSPDSMGPLGIETLKFRVEYESLFSWFKNSPDKKKRIETWLISLGRKFPEHWEDIIAANGKPEAEPTLNIETTEKEADQPDNIFAKDGVFWRITYLKKTIPPVKHTDGMQYISILLGSREPISAINLYQMVKAENINTMGGATEEDALLDKKALKALNKRLSELEDDLAEAETLPTVDRKEDVEHEIHQIKERLKKDKNIRNESRKFSDDEEKIRPTVRHAVNTAINNITLADKELGEHLKQTIEIGKQSFYISKANHTTLPWAT